MDEETQYSTISCIVGQTLFFADPWSQRRGRATPAVVQSVDTLENENTNISSFGIAHLVKTLQKPTSRGWLT